MRGELESSNLAGRFTGRSLCPQQKAVLVAVRLREELDERVAFVCADVDEEFLARVEGELGHADRGHVARVTLQSTRMPSAWIFCI